MAEQNDMAKDPTTQAQYVSLNSCFWFFFVVKYLLTLEVILHCVWPIFPNPKIFLDEVKIFIPRLINAGGPRWRSWLRHCSTIQKVAGSIPCGVIGIFHWHNPSGRTMALGSTQPLTEMSTGNIYWG